MLLVSVVGNATESYCYSVMAQSINGQNSKTCPVEKPELYR